VILQIPVKWRWFNAQELPDVWDHPALLVKHNVGEIIVDQSFEK
jgi:hypothetical protein